MLPLPVPAEGDTFAEAVVDAVGAGVVAGVALLATTTGVEVVEDMELVEPEELVVETPFGVADAAQAHTALAEASTATPVTAPQPLRTLERAAVLIATVECYE